MRYLKYIFGIQLFLGSAWSFYYSVYWAGFLLLTLASIILIPLIYKLLKKQVGGFKAGCLIFAIFFAGLSWFGISYLMYILAPVSNNTVITNETKQNNNISVYAFEQSLNNATQDCFNAYNKAFSKSIKYKEEQCELVYQAKNLCYSRQQDVENISVPDGSNTELINILKDIKSDAKNSLKNWENFFSFYNKQCTSNSSSVNVAEVKLELASAIKNMYFMNMKIKKAKSIS